MHARIHHEAHVDALLSRIPPDAEPARVMAVLDIAMATMWRRARVTLGDVTVFAVVDRVLFTTVERFPSLWSLEVLPDGLRVQGLRDRGATIPRADVLEGIRFFLVEFLTVLGHLTAEILSPALHAELAELARHNTETYGEESLTHVARNDGKKGSNAP